MSREIVILGQSGGQIAEALGKLGPEWALRLAGGDSLVEHARIVGIYPPPSSAMQAANEWPGGLFGPEPTPLPPSTMTRQQRRYLARKGTAR